MPARRRSSAGSWFEIGYVVITDQIRGIIIRSSESHSAVAQPDA